MQKPKSFLYVVIFLACVLAGDALFAHESPVVKDDNEKANWFAATDEQIEKAPCKTQKAPSIVKMKSWLEARSVSDDVLIDEVVNGVPFRKEKQYYVKLFESLNSHIWDSIRPIEYKTTCDKFFCIVTEIFGTEAKGIKAAYILARYGYNTNHYVRPMSDIYQKTVDHIKPWSSQELDVLLMSLSDLPQTYPVTEYNKTLVKVDALYNNRDTVLANATINIFRPWLDESFYTRQATIVHEIGHNFDFAIEEKLEKPWSKLEGEKISRYANKNENEDFAESVVGYRYNANALVDLAPEKYEVLREYVFDGVEYLNGQSCRQPSRTDIAIQNAKNVYEENLAIIQTYLESHALATAVGSELVRICGYDFYSREKTRGDYNYRRCFSQHLRTVFTKHMMAAGVVRMTGDKYLDAAAFKNVQLPSIFILRVVTQFKTQLRQQMTNLLYESFQNVDGLGQHLIGQFYDIETFCSGFQFSSAYYQSDRSRRWKLQSGDVLVSELVDRIGNQVCRMVYANKKVRAPVDKIAVWFAVDEVLE